MRTRLIRSSSDSVPPNTKHQSVLLHEAVELLEIKKGDVVLDGTLGGAGHARAIAGNLGKEGTFIGFDLDRDAIARAKDALAETSPKVILIEANFRDLGAELKEQGIASIDKAIFDLGWSAFQLDAGRGFSFLKDEPLVMSYAKAGNGLTAADIVNEWEEKSIADVLFGWGEERFARRIAKAIVEQRAIRPFKTSRELGEAIKQAVPAMHRYKKLHPATKSFQALRIAVNDELGALEAGLRSAWQILSSDGRIAVITFHSIEDRIAKNLFRGFEEAGEGRRVNKSTIKPSREEVILNPRARSAQLRVIEKSQTSPKGNKYKNI